MHRFRAATIVLVVATAALTACAPPGGGAPDAQEQAALKAWADGVVTAAGAGVGVSGSMSTDDAAAPARQSFAAPTAFTSVQLRCKGTDRAQFALEYTGAWGTQTLHQEVVCHDGGLLTPIAIPTDVQALTGFAASATSPDGRGYWVAIPQR